MSTKVPRIDYDFTKLSDYEQRRSMLYCKKHFSSKFTRVGQYVEASFEPCEVVQMINDLGLPLQAGMEDEYRVIVQDILDNQMRDYLAERSQVINP